MIEIDFFLLNLSGMAVVGAIFGFLSRKLVRVVAALAAAQIALLLILEQYKVITVDWTRVSAAMNETEPSDVQVQLADYLVSTGLFSAAFASGFALGFYKEG